MPTNLPVRRDLRDHGLYVALIPIVALAILCALHLGPVTFAEGTDIPGPLPVSVTTVAVMVP